MNIILEEIRERIKDRMAILGVIRDDDEYANGQSVSLAIALRIIDEVEKEYSVPTEEGKTLQKLREFLATATPEELEAKYRELEYLLAPKDEDANKAAEEACAKCPISGRCFVEDKERKDACDYLRGVKAGIVWEKEQMEKKISLIQKSWYDEGKIAGKYEGLTDDEKYQQGAFDERERLMKDAVEVRVKTSPLNGPLGISAYCCNFPSEHPFYRCKDGDKVSVIIIKKEK